MRAMDFAPALTAFVVSLACLGILLSPIGRGRLLDRPNNRSLHVRPVPRSGGIAIAAGIAVSAALAPRGLGPLLVIAGVLAAMSLADDLFTLPTLLRLGAHLAAAGAALGLAIGVVDPLPFALLLLAIAWYANLYNFMDGSDGLAAGMAVFGFGAYAWAAQQSGADALSALCASIAAASGAFLLVNFHPARLFMGDAGSVPLGFLAGALGVLGWREGTWPLWFPVLAFAPFACDATLTLLKRLLRRERVWEAHRDHYYQRLVRMGYGHRGTAWIEYTAMAGCAGLALFARKEEPGMQLAVLSVAVLALVAIALWVDMRWARWIRANSSAGASA
jgi:UDP-N-acetylmuramyl pentapeptide phosphotransferase/UDP-N-acetylglucosamine-1-phosphate transferase